VVPFVQGPAEAAVVAKLPAIAEYAVRASLAIGPVCHAPATACLSSPSESGHESVKCMHDASAGCNPRSDACPPPPVPLPSSLPVGLPVAPRALSSQGNDMHTEKAPAGPCCCGCCMQMRCASTSTYRRLVSIIADWLRNGCMPLPVDCMGNKKTVSTAAGAGEGCRLVAAVGHALQKRPNDLFPQKQRAVEPFKMERGGESTRTYLPVPR